MQARHALILGFVLACVGVASAVFVLRIQQTAAGHPAAQATARSLASPGSTATAIPRPTATPLPPPQSWLRGSVLFTIYGRGFATAPILGRLGMDDSFVDMQRQIQPFLAGIRAHDGGRQVRVAVHLIYALALPCSNGGHCLGYLDDTGVNIVQQYIRPAARRGWLVILDDQLGTSNPVAEMRRITGKGYLRFDNVGVALDPEFRAVPGQADPGVPVGSVTAQEINQAGALLSQYAERIRPRHHKLLLVHEFQTGMISRRQLLRQDYPNVDIVLTADGFGTPGIKAHVYHDLLGPAFRRIRWRAIKLFYPNPYEHAGHGDNPLMSWPQVFGRAPAWDGRQRFSVWPPPNVVIVA